MNPHKREKLPYYIRFFPAFFISTKVFPVEIKKRTKQKKVRSKFSNICTRESASAV